MENRSAVPQAAANSFLTMFRIFICSRPPFSCSRVCPGCVSQRPPRRSLLLTVSSAQDPVYGEAQKKKSKRQSEQRPDQYIRRIARPGRPGPRRPCRRAGCRNPPAHREFICSRASVSMVRVSLRLALQMHLQGDLPGLSLREGIQVKILFQRVGGLVQALAALILPYRRPRSLL